MINSVIKMMMMMVVVGCLHDDYNDGNNDEGRMFV